jgi:hypothetical protein
MRARLACALGCVPAASGGEQQARDEAVCATALLCGCNKLYRMPFALLLFERKAHVVCVPNKVLQKLEHTVPFWPCKAAALSNELCTMVVVGQRCRHVAQFMQLALARMSCSEAVTYNGRKGKKRHEHGVWIVTFPRCTL